jgi:hypothetical protein
MNPTTPLPPNLRLWLDDGRPRPADWDVMVLTAPEAMARLASGVVSAISLDHDLGPAEAGTGYDGACGIEEAAHEGVIPRLDWRLHTDNPVGRERMRAALVNADRFWERREGSR